VTRIAWQYPGLWRRLRWLERAVRLVPYAALATSTVLDVLWWPRQQLPGTLALVAVAALWLAIPLVPQWTDKTALMAGYYAGLIALAVVLVARSPVFGYFAFTGYLHTIQCLRGWWRIAGVVATATILSVSQLGGVDNLSRATLPAFATVVVFNATVSAAVTILTWIAAEQTEAHRRTIEKLEATMAENAGLHTQLLASAREAGVHDERERLAGEIHDTLAQGLIGIITQLQAAEQTGAEGNRHRHLDTAARLARDSLSEARRSVRALRPEPLEDAALPEALSDVVARWSADTGVPAELASTGTARPIHPELEVSLLRTAQEALANVAKHADASRVRLTLSYMEDVVSLDIRDDGRGFGPAGAPPDAGGDGSGFGLTAMRQRLLRVAGTLAVESEPGTGTAVSASVPAVPA
jgi:signal transduction histidine kinase